MLIFYCMVDISRINPNVCIVGFPNNYVSTFGKLEYLLRVIDKVTGAKPYNNDSASTVQSYYFVYGLAPMRLTVNITHLLFFYSPLNCHNVNNKHKQDQTTAFKNVLINVSMFKHRKLMAKRLG